MQTLIDLLVLVSSALVAVSVVRAWGSPQSIRNLLFVAFGFFGLAAVLTARAAVDAADYAATVAYYLLCAAVVAFVWQSLSARARRGD